MNKRYFEINYGFLRYETGDTLMDKQCPIYALDYRRNPLKSKKIPRAGPPYPLLWNVHLSSSTPPCQLKARSAPVSGGIVRVVLFISPSSRVCHGTDSPVCAQK